jgi:hypothetical protein
MLVLCDGVPKSGSTFLWQVCKRLAKDQGMESLRSILGSDEHFYIEPGNNTLSGFSNSQCDLIQAWLDAQAATPIQPDKNYCVKVHILNRLKLEDTPIESYLDSSVAWLVTVRDPFDVAQAIIDQAEKELQKPAELQRVGFARLSDPDKAMRTALHALQNLRHYHRPGIFIFPYPDFITGTDTVVANLRQALKLGDSVSDSGIRAEIKAVDESIRSGKMWGEFNQGRSGRGEALREQVDPALASKADEVWAAVKDTATQSAAA